MRAVAQTESGSDPLSSFVESYPELLSRLQRWFKGRSVPYEESVDLAQDTVERTLLHLKRHGRGAQDVGPLAFHIAKNLFVERIRKARATVVPLTEEIDVADSAAEPLAALIADEERSDVRRAISLLGHRHRRVIELWMRGNSPAEIARELGIKRNAADALLHRARRRLASDLSEKRSGLAGFIPLAIFRVRTSVRRLATIANLPETGWLIQASATVATIGAAAAIASAPIYSASSTYANSAQLKPSVASTSSARAADRVQPSHLPANGSPGVTVNADVARESVSAGTTITNPATGQPDDAGLDLWYKPNREHPGVVDTAVMTGSDAACGAAADLCTNRGK